MSLRNRGNQGHAEMKLCKSAKLLSKAIAMKPMSLIAVGQLGNTYLLHGELKLKLSRELRNLLSTDEPSLTDSVKNFLFRQEENTEWPCQLDGNDIRAPYNWGLALSCRAQLIADIGPLSDVEPTTNCIILMILIASASNASSSPFVLSLAEAAYEVDKVFMAAIDKFDAMLSRSKSHAPEALFRWGMALQQCSHLRPRNSKEKVKLLQQAKRFYEDALVTDEDNLQVREALSCAFPS
ncbi:hypothetical protein RJ641_002172 [Dillenia turbinata]|uniref:Uncharacterized protein n=1 Tax=Dillenia turbinata TaxID=194707 RepID=A0AAN8VRH9_9MAGN